jgi:hypothetical protein
MWRARPARRRLTACGLAVCVAVMTVACEPNTPTGPQQPNNPATAVETFSGTVPKGGSTFYSFTVTAQGNVSFTLLSLTIGGVASDLALTIGLGVPSGTACQTSSAGPVSVGPTPQQSNPVVPAVYCVNVADQGTLTADAAFVLNINRPR